jgi:hypothetical protein
MSERDIRERIVRWHDPDVTASALRDLSGIEALRAVMRGEFPPPPMARLLGFTLREVEEGRAVIEGLPAEYHYNPIGSVHARRLCAHAL